MTLNIANLDRLISHLEGLPEEKFDMQAYFTFKGAPGGEEHRGRLKHTCGTAGCIAGWIFELDLDVPISSFFAGAWLGLNSNSSIELFIPHGYDISKDFPLSRAIRTLKHMRAEFLRTGQVVVDWDAPEPAARKDWVAPKVSEQKLPAEITKLLTTFDRVEVL